MRKKLGSLRIEYRKPSLELFRVSKNGSSLSSLESEPRLVTSLEWSAVGREGQKRGKFVRLVFFILVLCTTTGAVYLASNSMS